MPFHMLAGESVPDGIRRVAREQVEAAIEEISNRSLPEPEKIHQIRKRCKKLRAVLRLVRPGLGEFYASENAFFRDAARLLSPLRDTQSVLDAYDGLMERFRGEVTRRALAPIRRHLVQRKRRRASEVTDLDERLERVRGLMEDARERIGAWPIEATGAAAWREGFEQAYRQARRGMARAYESPTVECFHEWRKGVKYHWYHSRLLRPLWSRALGARAQVADDLGEMLGDHHDLAVLRATLLDEAHEMGDRQQVDRLVELIGRRRAELEAEAKPLGELLCAEKPRQIGARHARYWDAWQERQHHQSATGDEPVAASA
jgi:CHAD domain-containing protein